MPKICLFAVGERRWLTVLAVLASLLGVAGAARADHPREVRMGVYANEPKIFLSGGQQPSGIFGELALEMARQHNWTLVPVPCEWKACLAGLQDGSIDLMPDVAFTPERANLFDFHATPALLSWSQIYARPDTPIRSALDLKDRRIAVLQGSVQQEYLRNLMAGFGVQAELVPAENLQEAFNLASRGEVDAAVANRFFGDLQAPRFKLVSTPVLFQPSQLFFATGKGKNADLIAAIESSLKTWQAQPDSHYFQVLKHWMEAPPRLLVPTLIWWALGGLGGVLVLALGAWWFLRREVAEKTRSLRASEDRLNTILDSVDAYIYIKDTALRYQYANRKVCELFGAQPEQVVGQTDARYFDDHTVAKLRINDLRVVEHGERVEEEETNRNALGGPEHTYLSVKLPLHRPDGSIYALCGISTDISKQKQTERAIHQLAFYDPLTQLPNRRLLMERLQQALAAQQRNQACGALMFIDVDNFKDLNDTLGHSIGDLLLGEIAARLSACTRAQDTLARQGGDEFVAMVQGLGPTLNDAVVHTQHLAEKILRKLSEPYLLDGHGYQTSVSIGIAMFGGPDSDQDELLKQADLAMYQAKADGRNTVRFFNPQMQAQVTARTALETDLHRALEARQFLLYYQTQVDQQGQTVGVEALVRWQHPVRGLVSPAEFIPVAESSGLILALGHWILETACTQLVRWAAHENTAGLSIAVNLSARQFRQSDFVAQVQSVLQTTGANPQRLELELTESQLIDDLGGVVQKMDALKALGVRIALDDFGTGYSSLNVLKRLPLDQLKIDQSFVHDLLLDHSSASIVRAIVTLGDSLQLQVIAEGVETTEQRDALVALGCTYFQGYLFGRPAPMQ
ncbi:EAL domain-containing protein [Rhodoferax sp. TS-BS-61-7]|uniref:EAL domain-containing protein n=1 Tax=Rhodoferax sp. TS-BS-61-7 TaxID=2094194 RepID=UPI000CF70F73|nr:EAL domain-containing protein [Rhodoferax sp. TS-BS-61-7]PQA76988.1 diguanylate cyclase [Rhodoferax sp. TS-BS-61-7]